MKFIDHWLTYSRSERRGLIALILVILSVYSIRKYRDRFNIDPVIIYDQQFLAEANAFIKSNEQKGGVGNYKLTKSKPKLQKKEVELFNFDPNHATEEDFLSLGFSSYVAANIIKYRKKGGVFTSPEDLNKIYGMEDNFFNKIEGFIELNNQVADTVTDKPEENYAKVHLPLDINRAGKEDLMKIYGIGEYFAQSITKYRQNLGGFYDLNQLKEIYGMDSIKFNEIKDEIYLGDIIVSKMNINKLKSNELIHHPYIDNWKLANAIEKYRLQHGPFASISELKKIKLISDSLYHKLEPYLTIK